MPCCLRDLPLLVLVESLFVLFFFLLPPLLGLELPGAVALSESTAARPRRPVGDCWERRDGDVESLRRRDWLFSLVEAPPCWPLLWFFDPFFWLFSLMEAPPWPLLWFFDPLSAFRTAFATSFRTRSCSWGASTACSISIKSSAACVFASPKNSLSILVRVRPTSFFSVWETNWSYAVTNTASTAGLIVETYGSALPVAYSCCVSGGGGAAADWLPEPKKRLACS